jgi:hypothetical protein
MELTGPNNLREARGTTAPHIADYKCQRRHAALVAVTLVLIAGLTVAALLLTARPCRRTAIRC